MILQLCISCRSSHLRFLWKKVFLEISQYAQENTCARPSLKKLQAEAYKFIKKETLAQVFSREFCKISRNSFFTEHLRTFASDLDLNGYLTEKDSRIVIFKNYSFSEGIYYSLYTLALSDCNWTRTQNHLVRKRTLNHLAKFWVRVQLQSLKLQISRLLRASSLTFRQTECRFTLKRIRDMTKTYWHWP